MIAADPIVLEPGSPEWLREMTASKVAAVLGLSPWESPFSLWYSMAGGVESQRRTAAMDRGHYLEPAICHWLADRFEVKLSYGGACWRNRERPWQVASPDRLVLDMDQTTGPSPLNWHPLAVVEVKTAADWEHWGPDGSDEIPPYYRTQVVWQMDTLGLPRGYVGVLLPRFEFRGYVIESNPGEVEYIREQARAFLDSIEAGQPPDVDSHDMTYRTVRALNPAIEDRDAEIEEVLAMDYVEAVAARRAADAEEALQTSRLALAMGAAHNAVVDGVKIAYRQTNGRGDPYVKAVKHLPNLEGG